MMTKTQKSRHFKLEPKSIKQQLILHVS